MKKIIFCFLLILLGLPLMAQDDAEQVLVFRNTGEVNLFFSSELDSVVCSHFDADSVWHEETVSQVFYGKDTTLVVPLAEVDSVCFGSRNETVFHPGVHQLSEQDIEWLIRYEDNRLFFRGDTPDGILPKTGEKLFAQQYKPKVPLGICAQVDGVAMANGEWVVTIHDVELSDIFERLFYAGKVKLDGVEKGTQNRISKWTRNFEGRIRVGGVGLITVNNDLIFDADIVAQPLRGYYSLEADITNSYGATVAVSVESDFTYEEEIPIVTIPLGVFALVFTPEITINTFVELNAELSIDAVFGHETTSHISYVKRHGEDPVFSNTNTGNAEDDPFTQVDITCKGELFMGGEAVFDFNILRELAGARLKLKAGPSFNSEFGLGMLGKASERYSPEVYGKAQFNCCAKVKVEGTVYTRNILSGDENEHDIFHMENKFFERTLDLFPRFFASRAVQAPPTQQPQTEVTTATKTDNDILKEVEVGFQLLDENEAVQDSIFVGQMQAQKEEVQGFQSEFMVRTEDVPPLMRPVFHYAGYTIPTATTNVLSNVQIQPVIFSGSNGAVTFVASYPFRGEVTKDSTNYRAGAYLPIPVVDSVFVDKDSPTTITPLTFIDSYSQALLYGTWKGTQGDVSVTYVFKEDGTGSLNGRAFTYETNQPMSGKILVTFENEERNVMSIVNLQESILQYRLGNEAALYMLVKQ